MIQDIAPHTYHNDYKPSAPDKNSFILAYEKGSILLPHQEREADIRNLFLRPIHQHKTDGSIREWDHGANGAQGTLIRIHSQSCSLV